MKSQISFQIQPLVRKLITRQSLSLSEALEAFDSMLVGKLSDAEIASFLVALAMKGESATEISAAVASITKHSLTLSPKVSGRIIDVCGTGGDSKSTFNISTAAAIVASAAGGIVAKHGNRSSSGVCGSADFMEAVGFNLECPPSLIQKSIEQFDLGFLFAPTFHPLMKNVSSARKSMGARSVFNIAGPLCNPCDNLSAQVIGVYSQSLASTLEEVFDSSSSSVMIVSSGDGLDELSTSSPNNVVWIRDNSKERRVISADSFGLKPADIASIQVKSKEESVAETLKVVAGVGSSEKEGVVVLNAAAALLVAGISESIEDGIRRSLHAISSGAARGQLEKLIALCGSLERLEMAEKKYLGS